VIEVEDERRHNWRVLAEVAGHCTVLLEECVDLLGILVQPDDFDVDVVVSKHPDMLLAMASVEPLEEHLDHGHIGHQDMAHNLEAGLGTALSENLTLAGRDTRPRRARLRRYIQTRPLRKRVAMLPDMKAMLRRRKRDRTREVWTTSVAVERLSYYSSRCVVNARTLVSEKLCSSC
jgi:hypothetical protein